MPHVRPVKIMSGLFRWLLWGAALTGPPGCSTYWPLSEELEEQILKESKSLHPSIDDHEKVFALGLEAAEGRLSSPEDIPLPEKPDLEDYVRQALERNPKIQSMVRTLEALGMKVPQVTSLRDPTLAFVPPTGALTQTADGEVKSTLGLSQQIPFPTKLAARGRVAEQIVRMGLENLRSTRLQVIADVKSAYYSYYLTSVSIDVTRENQSLLERIRDVADAKFRAGTALQQDVLRAEVEFYELSNDLLTLEQERRVAVAHLNVLMDRAVEAELPPPEPFDPEAVGWELEGLMARAVERSPALRAIQEQVRRDLESVRLARMEYLPDFLVGGGYSFIGGGISSVATGKDVWNLTLGMTLPIWLRRIRAGILEKNARTLASALEYRSRRNDVFFAIQDSLVRVDAQYRKAILLRDAILPRARQTVEVSESGYQTGQVDFLTWIDNWRRFLSFSLEYHRALASLERNYAVLEELVGGGLSRSTEVPRESAEGDDGEGRN